MKKLIFGLIAVVFFGMGANAGTLESNEKHIAETELIGTGLTKIMIHIDVTWGRKSRGCKGFGICDVDFDVEIDQKNMFSGTNDGNFTIVFDDEGLKNISNHFGDSSTITIEEDFNLSDKLCEVLELKPGYTVKKGKYNIQKIGEGTYSVSF